MFEHGSSTPARSRVIANADPGGCLAPHAAEVREALERVLASGRFILGPELRAFEEEFAAWLGGGHCVGVANGTDAIELALRAVGVREGDGVVVPANTASASVAGILAAGARPVFCDVDPETMCIDTDCLNDLPGPLHAVLAVHLYGHPCDMDRLMALAARRGLKVVEDCAQAHGAAWAGRSVGIWGDVAAFSFYPTKNLAALGDGGGVVTRDPVVAGRIRALRQYGWQERYVSSGEGGRNSRLDEMHAAVLRVRLRHLRQDNHRRGELASRYFERLVDSQLRLPPRASALATQVWHQYVVRTPDREGLCAHLAARGVHTQALYPVPLHKQPAFARWAPAQAGSLVECEGCCREVLSLPVHPALRDEDVKRVCAEVLAWTKAVERT